MNGGVKKPSPPVILTLTRRAYNNPPSDLHRAIADELIRIGRLAIVDESFVDCRSQRGFGQQPAEVAA